MTVIILSPILSGAKVGPLEFTFLDSQRSAAIVKCNVKMESAVKTLNKLMPVLENI